MPNGLARRRSRHHRQPSDFFLQHVVGGLAQRSVLEHHGQRAVHQLGNPSRAGALRIEQIAAGHHSDHVSFAVTTGNPWWLVPGRGWR